MRTLSKSKLIAFRQCPKRLWLEIHKPELRDDSVSKADFMTGNEVGELAQELFDEDGNGTLIDPKEMGWPTAYARSAELLKLGERPIFEATMRTEGALAMADVMLPDSTKDGIHWKMIEVKSSTRVKHYHRDDVAIQYYIALKNEVALSQAGVAYINKQFVYQGDRRYDGIFEIEDLTDEASSRLAEVEEWIHLAQATAFEKAEPKVEMGPQCSSPFTCPFTEHCGMNLRNFKFPVSILPRLNKRKMEVWKANSIYELSDVPDDQLNSIQQRVKDATLTGKTYFDSEQASAALQGLEDPAHFVDFETVNLAIPIWKGTRPYQQIPFQFSAHRLLQSGELKHCDFLDLSCNDPRERFSENLITACGEKGPIFVYNAGFEKSVIRNLAEDCPDCSDALNALLPRVVDLLPIVRNTYYHPSQRGSWSLKAVLPTICPELAYDNLDGIQHGGAASEAFTEALKPETSQARRKIIDRQLREYCKRDTFATVKLFEFLKDSSYAGHRE